MDLDEARAYVREHSHAVLSTVRRDGTPQLSPVAATVDDAGRVVVSSRETAYKTRNLRRDPRASYEVVSPDLSGWAVGEGIAELLDAAEDIVNAAGPEILRELRALDEKQRKAAKRRNPFKRKR